MNRRSFIKRVGMLAGLLAVNPASFIADAIKPSPKPLPWEFYSNAMYMDVTEYSQRYIQPAAQALANNIDKEIMALI